MKVEFTVEECHRMFEAVVEQLLELDLDKADRAALRRWRAEEMTAGSAMMKRLAERMNGEIQHSHDRSEVSQIQRPDWV